MTPPNPLLRRAQEYGTPIIQGNRATFIWEGETAPLLISDSSGWDERPKAFKRLSVNSRRAPLQPLWSTSLTIPPDAYVEYAFLDPDSQEHILDPYNTRSTSNGMGNRNNFFYMPEAAPSPVSLRPSLKL